MRIMERSSDMLDDPGQYQLEFCSQCEEDTAQAAQEVAKYLKENLQSPITALVALVGDLGAGKTCFAKSLIAEFVEEAEVSSPTFPIVNEHLGAEAKVAHFDFYRLDTAEKIEEIGWEEYLEEGWVVVVEWADKFLELIPKKSVWVYLGIDEKDPRVRNIKMRYKEEEGRALL